ncbi:inactive ubiquitin carboxyl-terminal hydrolase MINDY-4B-like [Anneissia japonica]|uniref:inactive ubiquitin carboxyl-terminal hydrolase MINDY-4B-like n=1 Tax=Anneissia japonica TaxID=1529436 RepID=UPI0014256A6F|nr:inactive ubiquitin carboxyl-terminal hydrolase MINDY-4B-like [Anneissia japonica]
MATLRDRIKRLNLKSIQTSQDGSDDDEFESMDPLERLARTLELTAAVPKFKPQDGQRSLRNKEDNEEELSDEDGVYNPFTHPTKVDLQIGPRTVIPSMYKPVQINITPQPVCFETAAKLRDCLFGNRLWSFSPEWKQDSFQFQAIDSAFPYGLWTTEDSTRNVIICVQAYIMKNLLFLDEPQVQTVGVTASGQPSQTEKLKPFEQQRCDALIKAISDMLWQAGEELSEDLQGERLILPSDRCSTNMVKLLLTGQATPYLFNGSYEYDEYGDKMVTPQIGLSRRSDIGIMYLDHRDGRHQRPQIIEVGTMLKTPKYPVWVTYINGKCGLLFCLKRNLLREARSEHCFDLRYYTGQRSQTEEAKITVDNISKHGERKKSIYYSKGERKPLLEECISSRWPEALIDWHGTLPFI